MSDARLRLAFAGETMFPPGALLAFPTALHGHAPEGGP